MHIVENQTLALYYRAGETVAVNVDGLLDRNKYL